MAIVIEIDNTIKSSESVLKAIEYITNPKKVQDVFLENCSGNTNEIAKQFYITRKNFNKNKNILAHHYVQSFSPDDNVTPEQAHKIGQELIKKIAPDYQVILGTHVDKDHIHNHFIINSCNLKTGYKWHGNKNTLNQIRNESDILCHKNGLSVIEKTGSYKGIDQTTYQLAKKGKSWKVNLVKDLDFAIENCKSKNDFVTFLNEKDYSIRYTDKNITITKLGEKKGIRVDTLAKQFGNKYSKEKLEKAMGYYIPPQKKENEKVDKQKIKKPKTKQKTEWERFEKWHFKDTPVLNISNKKSTENFKKNPHKFSLKLFFYSLLKRKLGKKRCNEIYLDKKYTVKSKELLLAEKKWNINQLSLKTISNISYKKLIYSQGENYKIKVNADIIPKLFNQPIFYTALMNTKNGTATLTIKEKDRELLKTILGVDNLSVLDEQNKAIKNREVYNKIKSRAVKNNSKVQYLVVTPEQLKMLQAKYVELAYFKKGDKFNIAFLSENKNRINEILFLQKKETPFQKNNRINKELKNISALTGDKLRYKLLTKQQLDNLKQTDIRFAVFYKKENQKYNVVYLDSDSEQVKKATQKENQNKKL